MKTNSTHNITMKQNYLTPAVEQIPMMVEQAICSASTTVSGGEYNPFPDDFDSDSD